MSRHRCPLLALAVLLVLGPFLHAEELAEKLRAVLDRPAYKQSHWGMLVVESETGKLVYEHNADRLFAPASTTKLYSCATALGVLGPDYRFETPVYRRGPVEKGILKGDLILVASGDLTMGGRTDRNGKLLFKNNDHTYASWAGKAELTPTDPLAGLKSLARQVRAAGIEEITGEILVDDRLFARARGSGSGPDLLTPIIINDNVIDVIVTPGEKVGAPARVQMRPETSFLKMDAKVTTVDKGEAVALEILPADPGAFTVRGRIPLESGPRINIFPIDDPAGFARALFLEALRGAGVNVKASPLRTPHLSLPERSAYAQLAKVAVFTSPPLSEAIKVTLKVSHNLYASTLPLLVAAHHGKRTLAEGLKLQGKHLKELGVPVETISFGGGAGGANADMITPRATVQLLRAMTKRPEYSVYKESLPILGEDGTLAEAVAKDSPARGKASAKTGTLGWLDQMNGRLLLRSKALAGVMTTAKGKSLTFAIFLNDVPLPPKGLAAREGKTLGHLCELLYQHGP